MMETQPPQPGPSGSESSRLAGTSTNRSHIGTQQERRHQSVHHNVANEATKTVTQDAHFNIVRRTGSCQNTKQHAVECEFIHTVVNGRQLTVYHAAGIRRVLSDQFFTACNRNPPWLTNAYVRTVHDIEPQNVVSSGIFVYPFRDYIPESGQNRL